MRIRNIRIKKVPFEIILFTIIVLITENFMYLVDLKKIKIPGSFNIQDINIVVYLVFFILVYIKYIRFKRYRYMQCYLILLPIILVITSSIKANEVYGQPLMLGIRPQRFFILTYLLYFPLKRMFECNKKSIEYVKKILIGIGTIELFLYIAQYLLINKVIFLSMRVSQRFGEVRLPFESLLLLLFPFIIINELLNKRNIRRNFILLALSFFYIVVVLKTRMVMISMVSVVTFLILIYKSGINKKVISIFLLIIVGVIAVNTEIGQSYIQSISSENRAVDPNSLIRKEAQKFYITETAKSPITGRGYVNILYKNSVVMSRYDKGYYFNDNGIIGFYYLYGAIGVMWLIIFFIYMLKKGYYLYKKKNNYCYLGYSIYNIITCITMLYCYAQNGAFYLTVILVILQYETNQDDNLNNSTDYKKLELKR